MKETIEERERTAMEDKARELLDAYISKCIKDIHEKPILRHNINMEYLGYSKAMQELGLITLEEAQEGLHQIIDKAWKAKEI